jgi:Secretion system C-terminal sorting domain
MKKIIAFFSIYLFSISSNAQIPPNDDCAGAVTLTVGNGFCTNPVIGTLTNASASIGVPSGCIGMPVDVWYKVVIPSGQSVIVQTSAVGSAPYGNDMLLQAIQSSDNTCDGTLVQIGCDDDGNSDPAPSGNMSRLTITNSGPSSNTYFLRVFPVSSNSIHPFAICAWTTTVPPIASGSNCVNTTTIIDSAQKYMWVPLVDAGGNIIAEIFPNGNKLGATSYSFYINTGPVRTDVNSIKYLDRNITITPTVQPASNVRVRLYYKSIELDALQLVDPLVNSKNINATKTTNTCANSASTIAPGEFLFQGANGSYNVTDSFINLNFVLSFSTFFLHGGFSAILPLKLLAFTAEKQNTAIKLSWLTTNEINTSHFIVQRSYDGRLFADIGRVNAKNTAGNNSYSLSDYNPLQGVNFYRLLMIDNDGKVTHSNVVILKFGSKEQSVSVYPNPVKKGEILQLSLQNITANKIELINAIGQVVYSNDTKQTGSFNLPILYSLMSGQYVLRVVSKNKVLMKKILLQ